MLSGQGARVERPWVGRVALWPGVGVFIGHSGDNRAHSHWAHQLVVGLPEDVTLHSGTVTLTGPAVFVRAGVSHQLFASRLLSVFIDPTTALSQAVSQRLDSDSPLCHVPAELAALVHQCFTGSAELETAMDVLLSRLVPDRQIVDERLGAVMAALVPGEDGRSRLDRRHLAARVGLSASRFSHWFKEATGMPLRSYRKWLHLVYGLEHALHGRTLTDSALHAEFADQAHFSRTFLQMFGVRASDVLAQVRLMPESGPVSRSGQSAQRSRSGMSFFDSQYRV